MDESKLTALSEDNETKYSHSNDSIADQTDQIDLDVSIRLAKKVVSQEIEIDRLKRDNKTKSIKIVQLEKTVVNLANEKMAAIENSLTKIKELEDALRQAAKERDQHESILNARVNCLEEKLKKSQSSFQNNESLHQNSEEKSVSI